MAGQFPRPWSFRLGSMTRPTTAPLTDQPRPVPARIIRPPIIRPPLVTEPEPTTPKEPAKSPPQLPRPAASLTPPVKKEPPPPSPPPAAVRSPPATASTKPVVPSPPATALARPIVPLPTAAAALTRPVVPSPSIGQSGGAAASKKPGSSPKGRSSVAGSPSAKNEAFEKGGSAKQGSPVPSPSIPKSIPAVPSPDVSPKPKVGASPPSPLVLPPPQLRSVAVPNHESIPQEVERKTIVFQKVMEKPQVVEQNGKQEAKKLHNENQEKMKGINGAKKGALDKDSNTRVITMAGENRGAFMEVVMSDKNNNNARHFQIRQNNDNDDNNNNNINETENEDNKSKENSVGIRNNNVALPMRGFFNSNVQGINNSILMDSKFAHHDPGIHLRLSKMPSPDKEVDQELQH